MFADDHATAWFEEVVEAINSLLRMRNAAQDAHTANLIKDAIRGQARHALDHKDEDIVKCRNKALGIADAEKRFVIFVEEVIYGVFN